MSSPVKSTKKQIISKPMALDANVLTLGKFLAKYRQLVVPNYQRTYKWEPEVAVDLFEDIVEGLKLSKGIKSGGCFLGSIVLSDDRNGGVTDLVDGQQRLTTLCILLRCLIRNCLSGGPLVNQALQLLGSKGTPVILHKSTNGSACDDRNAFRECAISEKPDMMPFGNLTSRDNINRNRDWKKALESHYIYKASKALDESIKGLAKDRGVDLKKASEDMLNAMIDGIKLVIINTDERKEGMRVFASINASGTKLEPWELVMSAFYSHAPSVEATKATESFFESGPGSIAKILEDKDRGEEDSKKNELLRSHWIARSGYIAKDDLFDAYNDLLAVSPENHSLLIGELVRSLRCHRAFTDFSYRHPSGVLDFEFLAPLHTLNAKLCRPALIATANLYDDPRELQDAMQRLSFFFERVHMRWKITDKRANIIDRPLATIAKKISARELGLTPRELAENVEKAFNELVAIQPSKDELILGFKAHNMTKELKLGSLIFQRLQHAYQHPSASDRTLDYKFVPKNDTISRYMKGIELMINEHDQGVRGYGFRDRTHFTDLIYTLGNIFASERQKFDDKSIINMGYKISEMTAESVEARLDDLAEVAASVWHR